MPKAQTHQRKGDRQRAALQGEDEPQRQGRDGGGCQRAEPEPRRLALADARMRLKRPRGQDEGERRCGGDPSHGIRGLAAGEAQEDEPERGERRQRRDPGIDRGDRPPERGAGEEPPAGGSRRARTGEQRETGEPEGIARLQPALPDVLACCEDRRGEFRRPEPQGEQSHEPRRDSGARNRREADRGGAKQPDGDSGPKDPDRAEAT
jgi:hypothetical protein